MVGFDFKRDIPQVHSSLREEEEEEEEEEEDEGVEAEGYDWYLLFEDRICVV